MKSLINDINSAKILGMSYGNYKALQREYKEAVKKKNYKRVEEIQIEILEKAEKAEERIKNESNA